MGIAMSEQVAVPRERIRGVWSDGACAGQDREKPYVPGDYLPGVLRALVASGTGVARICLDGVGRLEVDAGSFRFHAEIGDWDAFCIVPKSHFRIEKLPAGVRLSGPGRPIDELFWIAGYYASSGRLPAYANRHEVIRLIHWPNFTRLPCTLDAYRLCALLAKRPSSIHLASRLVGVDEAVAFRFFSAAHAAGVIEMVTRLHGLADPAMLTDDRREESTLDHPFGVLLKSLWKKMVGR